MSHSPARVLITAALMAAVLLVVALAPVRAIGQKRSRLPPQKSPKSLVYSCPMHPEVKARQAGRCPKCGMDLRATKPATSTTTASDGGSLAPAPVGSRLVIPDVELLNQDGQRVHFYSDLVRNRVVVINFIFTTCTTICPPLGATFARVQKELGQRLGRDVGFISISVDPVTDTPERLKAWGAKFHADPAWIFVTGEKQIVGELLRALGAASASPQDHSPTVLIINDSRGQWTRAYGLATPSQLVNLITAAIDGNLDVQEAAKQ